KRFHLQRCGLPLVIRAVPQSASAADNSTQAQQSHTTATTTKLLANALFPRRFRGSNKAHSPAQDGGGDSAFCGWDRVLCHAFYLPRPQITVRLGSLGASLSCMRDVTRILVSTSTGQTILYTSTQSSICRSCTYRLVAKYVRRACAYGEKLGGLHRRRETYASGGSLLHRILQPC